MCYRVRRKILVYLEVTQIFNQAEILRCHIDIMHYQLQVTSYHYGVVGSLSINSTRHMDLLEKIGIVRNPKESHNMQMIE